MQLIEEIDIRKLPRRTRLGIYLFGFSGILLVLSLRQWLEVTTVPNIAPYIALVIVSAVPTIVLHETLHGLAFWLFKGKVKFGMKLRSGLGLAFYCTAPEQMFLRWKYQVVALAPQALTVALLLTLALASLPNMVAHALLIVAALNLGGGCGDIYAIMLLRKYPRHSYIEDTTIGCRIWEKSLDSAS